MYLLLAFLYLVTQRKCWLLCSWGLFISPLSYHPLPFHHLLRDKYSIVFLLILMSLIYLYTQTLHIITTDLKPNLPRGTHFDNEEQLSHCLEETQWSDSSLGVCKLAYLNSTLPFSGYLRNPYFYCAFAYVSGCIWWAYTPWKLSNFISTNACSLSINLEAIYSLWRLTMP